MIFILFFLVVVTQYIDESFKVKEKNEISNEIKYFHQSPIFI